MLSMETLEHHSATLEISDTKSWHPSCVDDIFNFIDGLDGVEDLVDHTLDGLELPVPEDKPQSPRFTILCDMEVTTPKKLFRKVNEFVKKNKLWEKSEELLK